MSNKQLTSLFGLKWNPFTNNIPTEAIYHTKNMENFFFRVENLLIDGGFAMITGDPGTGKSVTLRALAERLKKLPELTVIDYCRPQSGVSDFYRQICQRFGVELRMNNRWGGYRQLRERWIAIAESSMFRPIILVDEAQSVPEDVLTELRILSSMQFDSKTIIAVVLCGDERLPERFSQPELLPLGSRIKTKLRTETLKRDDLKVILEYAITAAGAPHLLTPRVIEVLAEHACGNLRAMMQTANELLVEAAAQGADKIDEALFFSYLNIPNSKPRDKPTQPKHKPFL